jgi:hypothetical protein
MKKSYVLAGLVLFAFAGPAGPIYASGTVWSEVKDNVAYVYHDDAEFNCCPQMVMTQDIDEEAKLIDIYEHDTLAACDCICNYDFTHKFDGLTPGEYTAKVWESYCKECEFTLAGTTTFVILSKINPLAVFDTMSTCHEAPGVEEKPAMGADLRYRSFLPVEIFYKISDASEVNVSIFDVSGRKVRTLFAGKMEAGEHIVKWDLCDDKGEYLPKGTYIATLEVKGALRSLPLIVLK